LVAGSSGGPMLVARDVRCLFRGWSELSAFGAGVGGRLNLRVEAV